MMGGSAELDFLLALASDRYPEATREAARRAIAELLLDPEQQQVDRRIMGTATIDDEGDQATVRITLNAEARALLDVDYVKRLLS